MPFPTGVHVFRLYPESKRSGLYVRALVFPTRRLAAIYSDSFKEDPEQIAVCISYKTVKFYKHGGSRVRPIVADVIFHRERMGMEVITHELFHATMAWARRVRFPFGMLNDGSFDRFAMEHEEILALTHGRFCRDFNRRAQHAGLYR